MLATTPRPASHFASIGKRVAAEYEPERLGTVIAEQASGEVIVEWDEGPATACYPHDLEPAPLPAKIPGRGDLVEYTDGQGITVVTTVRRVVIIPSYYGDGPGTRYYRLEGSGVLVADGVVLA